MDNEHAVLAADKIVGEAAVNAPASSSSVSSASLLTSATVSDDANSGKNLSTSLYDDDDDEEENVCRICLNPGDADDPLRYPCACSGSIKFVHQDCLLQWLNRSHARRCEVCKQPFLFSPVYAEHALAKLLFQEFVVGISMKGCNVLRFFLRLTFVLSVWFVIIPFITFWIWRFSFVRSFDEAQRLFWNHISTTIILTDCLHGFLLSASIVFIFLGATSLGDYFRHLQEVEDERDDGDRNGAGVARIQPAQANRNLVGVGNGEDAGGANGIVENIAARWEMQAARPEAHVEQMFDGLDDEEDTDDVPFDELVGMQGPLFHLAENAFTVLASNLIFLGAMILVPFHLGRFVHYHLPFLLSSSASPMLSTVLPLTEQALSLANIKLKNALSVVANLTYDQNPDNSVIGEVVEILKANATGLIESSNKATTPVSADILEASWVSDASTLVVGYMFVLSLVIFYFITVAVIRYTKGEPLIMGRFYRIASIVETIPSLFKQFLTAMKHLTTMIKVAFILVVELGVFPLMCGWWVDICTVRMFGKSIAQRVEFFSVYPLSSSFIHWAVGIVYMLQMSIFASLLRGVLRNGVLYFLRDPTDPNYNPLWDLIDDPVHKYARRVLLSVAVYGSLIVMLVYLPVKLAMQMAPSLFPLDILVSDPFTEIPATMLLFQICILFAIEHFQLLATIKLLLRNWFTAVGWALGLTDYLLPRPKDDGGQENEIQDPARQDRLHAQLGDEVRGVVGYRDMSRMRPAEANVNFPDKQSDSERSGFVLCILLLLLAAWMTLLLFNSMLIVVPISLGRALFNAVPFFPITHGSKCNDMYAFIIGSYIISTVLAGARYSIDQIKTKRVTVLLGQIWMWCSIVVKSSVLLSIWIFIIPVMIGLLFELLVIVPMRVSVDESPVFLLYQDWAFGLIFLKIWTQLVILDQMTPLVDDTWRVKFERVKENGFSRLQGGWVLREIFIPIVMKLLTAICFPYVLARGVFPVFGYPLAVNSAVYRFAWAGCLGFSLLCHCGKRFHVWFTNLHNTIRDDRYLIGQRLLNFGEGMQHVHETDEEEEEDDEDVILRHVHEMDDDEEDDEDVILRHVHEMDDDEEDDDEDVIFRHAHETNDDGEEEDEDVILRNRRRIRLY